MKTQSEIEKDVTKDIHISILQDTLNDLRTENKFIKKTVVILFLMLTFAIGGIIFQGLYYQHKMFKFLSETEFTSEIWMDNDLSNKNNMNVERR
jgi:hypothetical protein